MCRLGLVDFLERREYCYEITWAIQPVVVVAAVACVGSAD